MFSTITEQYLDKIQTKLDKYSKSKSSSAKKIALKLLWLNLKFLCTPHSINNKKSSFSDNKQHVSIRCFGGMGDFIFAAKYIEALSNYLSDTTEFDILTEKENQELFQSIFNGKRYIHNIVLLPTKKQYDLSIEITRFPKIVSYFADRLDVKTRHYVDNIKTFYTDNKLAFYNDYIARGITQLSDGKRENQADIYHLLKMEKIPFQLRSDTDKQTISKQFNIPSTDFITIQTGAGKHFQHITNEVRQWSPLYYEHLIRYLKHRYPRHTFIQLGESTHPPLNGIDIDLRSQTSVSELFCLLKHASLHVSQEGGMVIARHFLNSGPSIVLFGPTDEKFFGFDENINIANRSCLHPCEYITPNWMKQCLKTGSCAECMQNLTPNFIINQLKKSEYIHEKLF
ncbi:MAG: hypothetical protein IKZ02_06540 [Alphaproteobacteria bacterium]|nr:hypothetical protein [Alphaproteobacteria bacterium]